MRENLYTTKFTAGGNVWISSILQIYRRRKWVNILYPANLPPEAMLHILYPRNYPPEAMRENLFLSNLPPEAMFEYSLSWKFTAGGNAWISATLQIYRQRQHHLCQRFHNPRNWRCICYSANFVIQRRVVKSSSRPQRLSWLFARKVLGVCVGKGLYGRNTILDMRKNTKICMGRK